jgi:nucleotide-binding universal stress UspA family protein
MTISGDNTAVEENRIVVGFNGSPAAWDALRWATDEAARRDASLEIVTCLDEGTSATSGAHEVSPHENRVGTPRQQVEEAARVARCRGWHVPVTEFLASGSPGDVLVDHSRGAAMLVIGRQDPHSATHRGRYALSSSCLANADCQVTVVTSATRPGHVDDAPQESVER